MSTLLSVAAIDLARRESPRIVAATGLVFEELINLAGKVDQIGKLTSVRGGVWGDEVAPGCGHPVLRSTNMRGSHVDVMDVAWRDVPPIQAESCSLRTGDILVTKSSGSSDLVGKSALFSQPGDKKVYLFSNFVLRLRPNTDLVLPEYLAWFLRSPQSLLWRYDTQQNAVGLRNLQTKEFLAQQLPVPNKELQQVITTYFDEVEEGDGAATKVRLPPSLTKQQRVVARVEELAAKIEEARELRRQAMKQVDSLIISLHLAASGERLVKLDEVLSLDEDRQQVMLGTDYPQVGVRSFGLGLFPRETLTASQTTYKYFNRLYRGALVMSQVKGWEGAVAVCTDDLEGRYVSPEYRTFRCISDRLLPEYLAALVPTSWFWQQLKGLTRGVGARRERTRPEQFVQITIPLPDVNRQANMLAIFEQIRSLKQLETGTVAEFDALLPSILDRAFKERS